MAGHAWEWRAAAAAVRLPKRGKTRGSGSETPCRVSISRQLPWPNPRPPEPHLCLAFGHLVQHHAQHVCFPGGLKEQCGERVLLVEWRAEAAPLCNPLQGTLPAHCHPALPACAACRPCPETAGQLHHSPPLTRHASTSSLPACSACRSCLEIMARLYSSPAVTSSSRCRSMICEASHWQFFRGRYTLCCVW